MRCKCDALPNKIIVNNIAIRNGIYYYYKELPRINNRRRYQRISLKTRDIITAVMKLMEIKGGNMGHITADCGPVLSNETWTRIGKLDIERLELTKIPVPTSGTQQDLIDLELRRQRIKQIDEEIKRLKSECPFPIRSASENLINQQCLSTNNVYMQASIPAKPIPKYTCLEIIKSLLKKKDVLHPEVIRRNCRIVLSFINIKEDDMFDFEYFNKHFADIFETIKNKKLSESTIGHYKSALNDFLNEINVLYNGIYNVSPLISSVANSSIQGKETVPFTPFTETQLLQIFEPKHDFFKKHPEDFWACIIAMFVASRSNLAHTLRYKDIFCQDGIWCLRFIDDENDKEVKAAGVNKIKHAKTTASERIVPINSQMLNLGFIDFVHRRQEKTNAKPLDVIFPEILKDSQDDVKHNLNKGFFGFLKKLGIKQETLEEELANGTHYVFHSFRKVSSQTMEDMDIKPTYINTIVGWQGDGTTFQKNYGNGREIKKIVEENEKLKFTFLQSHFDKWTKIMKKID